MSFFAEDEEWSNVSNHYSFDFILYLVSDSRNCEKLFPPGTFEAMFDSNAAGSRTSLSYQCFTYSGGILYVRGPGSGEYAC